MSSSSSARNHDVILQTLELFMKLKFIELAKIVDETLTKGKEPQGFNEEYVKEAREVILSHVFPKQFHIRPYQDISLVEIHLVKRKHLVKHGKIPTFEALQALNQLVSYPIQSEIPAFVFISHKWTKNGQCDSEDNKLWEEIIGSGNGEDYLWLDKCSIPNEISWEEKMEMIRNLDQVVHAAGRVDTYTFNATDISQSGWCFVENVISATPTFTVLSDPPQIQKWQDKAQLLVFSSVEDTPTVLLKAVDYVFMKSDAAVFKRVYETLLCTLKTNYFNDFEQHYNDLLGDQYRQKVVEVTKHFSDSWASVGDIHALAQLRTSHPMREKSTYEARCYQALLRHQFALQYCEVKTELVPFLSAKEQISWDTPKSSSRVVPLFAQGDEVSPLFQVNTSRIFEVTTISYFMHAVDRNPWVVLRKTGFKCMKGIFDNVRHYDVEIQKLFHYPFITENHVLMMGAFAETNCVQLQHLCKKKGMLYISVASSSITAPFTSLDLHVKPLLVSREDLNDKAVLLRYPTTHGIPDNKEQSLCAMCYDDFFPTFESLKDMDGVRLLTCLIEFCDMFKISSLDIGNSKTPSLFLCMTFLYSLITPNERSAEMLEEKFDIFMKAWNDTFKDKSEECLRLLYVFALIGPLKEATTAKKDYDPAMFDGIEIPQSLDCIFGKGPFGTRKSKAKAIEKILRTYVDMIMKQVVEHSPDQGHMDGAGMDMTAMMMLSLFQQLAAGRESAGRE